VRATDKQVRKLMQERGQGATLSVASARAGMTRQTGAKYERAGKLPSELTAPRAWMTRDNPFEQDWKEVERMLGDTPDLQAKTIFDILSERNPSRYEPGQLRTLQRHIRRWHALQGDDRSCSIFFPQRHQPGEAMQTDFTHTGELGLSIAGEPYKPLLCHEVLPFSGWQWATPCLSESMLALRAGVQDAVFRLGKIPAWHQTDNSTGATHNVGDGSRTFNQEYVDFMAHIGMKARTTAIGAKEQNGTIEAHNGAFKRFLKQRILVRGHADFVDEAAFVTWLHDQLHRSNARRRDKLARELQFMRPLMAVRMPEYREVLVSVTSYSTINVKNNIYSVPPRLQGHEVKVRIYEKRIEVRFADNLVHTASRLTGMSRHAIDYRHVIWSLVRKPGAFARYCYRDDLFISPVFRQAHAALQAHSPGTRGDAAYLRLLHLAASTMQSDVETAVALLMEQGKVPDADAVKDLVTPQQTLVRPEMAAPSVDLHAYDQLITGAIQ
jgi:hypothetical protein